MEVSLAALGLAHFVLRQLIVIIKSKFIVIRPESTLRGLASFAEVCARLQICYWIDCFVFAETLSARANSLRGSHEIVSLRSHTSALGRRIWLQDGAHRSTFHDMFTELGATSLSLPDTIHLLVDSPLATCIARPFSPGSRCSHVDRGSRSIVIARVSLGVNVVNFASFFSHFRELSPKFGCLGACCISVQNSGGFCLLLASSFVSGTWALLSTKSVSSVAKIAGARALL